MASLDRVVVSPSLLENLDIHPVSLDFSLGMEEWTDVYLESIERTLSDSGIDTRSCVSAFDSSLHLPIIPDVDVDAGPSSSVTVTERAAPPSTQAAGQPARPTRCKEKALHNS